ncbi:MAG: hypothetical protein LAT64_05690 [Phycisphaerales bacterium]|nr:hypothetical protein [Planctomycetota bacterium]MCH8508249.1 hypothetical protein [Phycisphaerales bacterium]
MARTSRQTDAPTGLSTVVVLAIGLQLMLSGAALASSACGDSLDRTGVRRLSDTVVQAIREISERAVLNARTPEAGPAFAEAGPHHARPTGALAFAPAPRLSAWVLTLPPPAMR